MILADRDLEWLQKPFRNICRLGKQRIYPCAVCILEVACNRVREVPLRGNYAIFIDMNRTETIAPIVKISLLVSMVSGKKLDFIKLEMDALPAKKSDFKG